MNKYGFIDAMARHAHLDFDQAEFALFSAFNIIRAGQEFKDFKNIVDHEEKLEKSSR